MSGWNDPRFVITMLLIGLFGYAYIQDSSDEAMKGAIIAAFSTAYGFWLASKDKEQSTANTGKALDAIRAAQESTPLTDKPMETIIVNRKDHPVPTTDQPAAPDASADASAPLAPSGAPESPEAADDAPAGSQAASLPEYAR